jgi:hypothetical protein
MFHTPGSDRTREDPDASSLAAESRFVADARRTARDFIFSRCRRKPIEIIG